METQNLISIQQFCEHYSIPTAFINELKEYELIEVIAENDDNYIKITQITEVEKMIRLHYDLNINLEGVDAIYNLLNQVDSLKKEINNLQNKLNFYENE
ncbi:chaperone modulator CbpM [Polaribacter sp. Z014]|uniref:chaperone modulator CbpM n=1 Tax=unclassified Polaribacter TaxID=196858 RepID=UPI00193AE7DB|nr:MULTISPECIES: chaperone modulator CbpM [unclassified Polaribacter]MCL7762106.1 chaperone modulator CbpM [Polaribacter sp. Z014]QVY64464.1 chaperone modulator CbpM [Polaribacter sp. Q13]